MLRNFRESGGTAVYRVAEYIYPACTRNRSKLYGRNPFQSNLECSSTVVVGTSPYEYDYESRRPKLNNNPNV